MTRIAPTALAFLLLFAPLAACSSSDGGDGGGGVATGADAGSNAADAAASDTAGGTADSGSSGADTGSGAEDSGSSASDAAADVPPPTPKYQTLTVVELVQWLKAKDFLLINVHIPYAGDIPGTDASVPYNKIGELEAALGNDKGKKAVLYCKSGPMSVAAAKKLVQLGYHAIWDLPEAMIGWTKAGHKLDSKK